MQKMPCFLALLVASFTLFPGLAEATSLSDLTGASTSSSINSGNNTLSWQWNTLSGFTPGLTIASGGTSATNGTTLFRVHTEGNHSTSGVFTTVADFSNIHTGTNSTNYTITAQATSATHNFAIYGTIANGAASDGDAGVWGNAPNTSGAAYGVYGTSASPTGYAGYFNNSNGGYAAAFMGGKVGIGTATPVNLLDIGTSGGIHIASGIPTGTSMALYNNSGTLTWNGTALATGSSVSGTTNYIPVFTGSSSLGNSVIYQSSGNIGIGTSSPAVGLDIQVASTPPLRLRNTGSTAGSYWQVGPDGNNNIIVYNQSNTGVWLATGGTGWNSSSDRKLKKDIAPLADALSKIAALNGVTFHWKDEKETTGEHVGVIAQDVQKVYPQLVGTDFNGVLGVNYAGLIAPLIEAVKQLKADNENLRRDFEAYKRVHP